MEKGKQAKVVIARADPYEIFRMSTSDYDLWKSMIKTAKSKKKGNKSDITPNKQDNEVAVRDLQIDIPKENAIVEYGETDKVETPMDTEDRTLLKDTTTSIPEGTDAENSSTVIVAVDDVDAPSVEDTEIYDEPPKEIPKTVKKGAKSSAKGLTKKKTQPNESDPNSFDVETKKDLAEWYRENAIFINGGSGK